MEIRDTRYSTFSTYPLCQCMRDLNNCNYQLGQLIMFVAINSVGLKYAVEGCFTDMDQYTMKHAGSRSVFYKSGTCIFPWTAERNEGRSGPGGLEIET